MRYSFALLSFLFLFTQCQNTSTGNTTPTDETTSIKLDGTERWTVNTEMVPHIMEAELRVAYFSGLAVEDYHGLGKELAAHNRNLIKSCTMEGKGHDELHKWLLPHMEIVDELAEVTTVIEGTAVVRKLEISFQDYHQYFK